MCFVCSPTYLSNVVSVCKEAKQALFDIWMPTPYSGTRSLALNGTTHAILTAFIAEEWLVSSLLVILPSLYLTTAGCLLELRSTSRDQEVHRPSSLGVTGSA